jgi:transcriptional regulator
MPTTATKKLSPEVQAAREALRDKGWTKAEVARQLGLTRIHVSYVLNGHRQSRRILSAISRLPKNPNPA